MLKDQTKQGTNPFLLGIQLMHLLELNCYGKNTENNRFGTVLQDMQLHVGLELLE